MVARLPLARLGLLFIALGLLVPFSQTPEETASAADGHKPRPVDTDGVVPYRLECAPIDNWAVGTTVIGRT